MMPTISIRSLGGGELAITRPDGDTVSLADPDVIADPYPLYERLREIAPRFRSRSLFSGSWVFLDRDDVAALSRELEKAGVAYEIEVYSGAPHAFTHWDGDRYQKRADELSWDAFSDFLATNLSE